MYAKPREFVALYNMSTSQSVEMEDRAVQARKVSAGRPWPNHIDASLIPCGEISGSFAGGAWDDCTVCLGEGDGSPVD